ncbi:MAG TPA: hypothetical protein VKW08_17155 [Xanthobacteraceae bacterium]|jgi:hypothetical protein|nr:hypothetical protein [Xanthobacteraceae bacterium]
MRVLAIPGLASGLTLFAAVTQASASIVDVTYTGTVELGFDSVGAFGGVGSLTGDTYKAVYVFNTSLGATFSSAHDNYATGGTEFGSTSPALKASLTINGHTLSITPSYDGEIHGLNTTTGFGEQYHYAAQNAPTYIYNSIINNTGTLPASIAVPFSYTAVVGDSVNGGFVLDNSRVSGILLPETLTYSLPTATPIPDTWTMMLTGLTGFGLMLCRRRTRHAFAGRPLRLASAA